MAWHSSTHGWLLLPRSVLVLGVMNDIHPLQLEDQKQEAEDELDRQRARHQTELEELRLQLEVINDTVVFTTLRECRNTTCRRLDG